MFILITILYILRRCNTITIIFTITFVAFVDFFREISSEKSMKKNVRIMFGKFIFIFISIQHGWQSACRATRICLLSRPGFNKCPKKPYEKNHILRTTKEHLKHIKTKCSICNTFFFFFNSKTIDSGHRTSYEICS